MQTWTVHQALEGTTHKQPHTTALSWQVHTPTRFLELLKRSIFAFICGVSLPCLVWESCPASPVATTGISLSIIRVCECADDMGLGKTLQVLATSWALMNAQGPTGRSLVRKMLIVAPSSVISNWGKEIKKWIGAFQGECHRVLLPGKSAANLVRALAPCCVSPLITISRSAIVCA